MKKLIVYFCLILCFTGCKKSDIGGMYIGSNLYFFIENEVGEDLLNPSMNGRLNIRNMNHYYLINGEKVAQYNENASSPKKMDVLFNESSNRYGLNLYVNVFGQHGDINTSIIEYSNLPADTISIQVHNPENKNRVQSISRLWINNVEFDLTKQNIPVLVK